MRSYLFRLLRSGGQRSDVLRGLLTFYVVKPFFKSFSEYTNVAYVLETIGNRHSKMRNIYGDNEFSLLPHLARKFRYTGALIFFVKRHIAKKRRSIQLDYSGSPSVRTL